MSLSALEALHIRNVDVAGKTVFFRTDLNVPMADGAITDTTRIDRTAPGIADLAERGARVVVAAHYGRPKGQAVAEMSLAPIAPALAHAVGRDVKFAGDCIGEMAQAAISSLNDGEVLLLENLRYHAEEEAGDAGFAAALAEGIDFYVNDAFSAAHRAHASISVLAGLKPAYAGPLMAEELAALAAALEEPKTPVAAVVGGAKVSTKLAVLNNLVERVDSLIIGGGMANTFLYAQGVAIGASLAEADMADQARTIMASAEKAGCEIILPVDVVLSKEFKAGADARVVAVGDGDIADDEMILDAGPETVAKAVAALNTANTLVWNGPMGAFEIPPFDAATVDLARHAAILTRMNGLVSVAGGGDTVAALIAAGVSGKFHYVSTAGGAFLEWMEGKTLPGVAALMAE
ncbi:MAG: phosphoglycerate kinase [Alphaproteobacteria bacterium]|nr:phosphoglycerate kinase [Alphaproteobacteria bacterium]